jgi:lipopolysaccharide export system permease protein
MGNNTQTNAKSGDLYVTDDKKYLVIELQNGQRYENMQLNVKNSPNQLPYMRTSFTEYRTVFDLSEFNFSETDKELFKNHHSLLTMNQLLVGVDSILIRRDKRIVEMQQSCDNFFHFRRAGLIVQSPSDSVKKMQYHPYTESEPKEISELQNFADIFQKGERHSIYQRAQGLARNIKIQAENMSNSLPRFKEEVAAYENEIHLKLVFSVACILFLFIGAPMGAIIRKGGFGWPIFISFVFFMVFFVLHLTGERLATGLVWPTWMGSWLPILALFPVAVFLTFKAMNDSRVLSLEFFTGFFVSLFRKKVK